MNSQIDTKGLTITFVHLGRTIPKYLSLNLDRCIKLFPGYEILLVGDSAASKRMAQRLGVAYFHYDKEMQLGRLGLVARELSHDSNFRNGYWQKTFDRLISLEAVHWDYPDRQLLHVESDVVLFQGFPLDKFLNMDKLAWPKHNHEGDVASIVFSPNHHASTWLTHQLLEESSKNAAVTDMSALMAIRLRDQGQQTVSLPRIFSDRNSFGKTANGGTILFDGLHFGTWLLGLDPSAHMGIRANKVWHGDGHNPLRESTFILDGGFLEVLVGEEKYGVVNLHIHSKVLAMFRSNNYAYLGKAIEKLEGATAHRFFSPSSFFSWLRTMSKIWFRSIWSSKAWLGQMRRLGRKLSD